MAKQILILAGDGIGPEIVATAEQVLSAVNEKFQLGLTWEHGLLGGAAAILAGVSVVTLRELSAQHKARSEAKAAEKEEHTGK